jgi:Arc/MetJ-type ribon-helix-helix transcriptional regulator
MTVHLPEDVEKAIQIEVHSGRFASEDDVVAAAVRDYLQRRQNQPSPLQPAPSEASADSGQKPIWERILERSAAIPDEEWDKLPTDQAEQHDHCLYGTPKRPPS